MYDKSPLIFQFALALLGVGGGGGMPYNYKQMRPVKV